MKKVAKIKWTKTMLDELKKSDNLKEFCFKYKISKTSAYTKKRELVKLENETTIKEEVKTIEMPKKLEKLNNLILEFDDLINKGYAFYLQENKDKIHSFDNKILDYLHILEFEYDNLKQKDLLDISYNLNLLRKQRRVYKTELEFLETYKIETQNFINFMKNIETYEGVIKNKKYTTRELKQDEKKICILNENEKNELKRLMEENKKLKEEQLKNFNPEILERLIKLEKFNLKMNRKLKREKGEEVAIDRLDSNWRTDFNKLDDLTRNAILSKCYGAYKGLPIKEIKDFDVWEKILPEALVSKKYFLKEN